MTLSPTHLQRMFWLSIRIWKRGMSCGLFRAVQQMKINCEEDESGAARWQRSVGSDHLSKNNEEEKKWAWCDLRAGVSLCGAGGEWSRASWSRRLDVLLNRAFSNRHFLSQWPKWLKGNSEFIKWKSRSRKLFGWVWCSGTEISKSKKVPSICLLCLFCGGFSFIVRLPSLLESKWISCFSYRIDQEELEAWFWVALPGGQGNYFSKALENLPWPSDPTSVPSPFIYQPVSLALGLECLCYSNKSL